MTGEFQTSSETSDDKLPGLLGDIVCVIPVEDNDPQQASVLQGFSRSLMRHVPIIRIINTLPSDLWELTPDGRDVLLARRMSGQAPVSWFAQSHRALTSMVNPVVMPFTVIFLGPDHDIARYRKWIDAHSFPLTVVAESGGTIKYEEFDIQALRKSYLSICNALDGQVKSEALHDARYALHGWEEPEERDLGYKLGGHNSVHPNLMALYVAGYRDTLYGPFEKISDGIGPYVEQICWTSQSILDERAATGERAANQYFRRPPGLNLFAPAIYPHMGQISLNEGPFSTDEKRRFLAMRRVLEKQDGYAFDATTNAQVKALYGADEGEEPKPHFLMLERAAELKLATESVATLAASEVSAVIRLPNAVNRTAGQVRQFAQQYHARKTTERKRIEAFRRVQHAVAEAIPEDFLPFVEGAEEGIRLICDSHLEWMKIRGLPLCIQKDVTRIPVTPGNLFIDQLSAKRYQHLNVSEFSEILVLSALQEEDPISRFFEIAIAQFEPLFAHKVSVRTVRVRNRADLIEALNSFDGAMMVFDGHGGHQPGKAATLQLLEEEINIWELQAERPRIPPIVVLSACDTHAADRNHASTANGFLSIGARTVLGSVFPINAMEAASFVARLLYRVAEFVPSAHRLFNRSLTWMEIMGGIIRMQLLTDFCKRLEQKGIIDSETYRTVHLAGNMAINGGQEEWPFEQVIESLGDHGVDSGLARRELLAATANSTAISYLQLGRPETVIVHPNEGFAEEAEHASDDGRSGLKA
ncbi:CHAT domain-containing protein [Roseibium sp.]|uniref:CHAT domain-containing protein n=1 Tax=Roseibium sp. TaxID=1936156 RepID=UPI00329A5839